ncbi:MAG: hypothetical protein JWM16_3981 [Verrucomicrobiales bacterium]|nr:hypothetical protein [Verrucomicrobiales bacterium]
MKDLDAIYCAARELPPEDRPAYLTKACGNDTALRLRIEQMLALAPIAEAFITDVNGTVLNPSNHQSEKCISPPLPPQIFPP